MYTHNGKAYDFNGKRIWSYRSEDIMTAVELAAKAQTYLTRYFRALDRGSDKIAACLLNAAESYYAKAEAAKY